MPWKKFKSFEEAEQAQWCLSPDKDYFRRAFEMLETGRKLLRDIYPKGVVFKYKSIEEANEHKHKLLEEYFKKKEFQNES